MIYIHIRKTGGEATKSALLPFVASHNITLLSEAGRNAISLWYSADMEIYRAAMDIRADILKRMMGVP